MSTHKPFTTIERRGAGRRLVALVVGLLALCINIAAGAVAAQHRHAGADPLAQLTADLAVLCAQDGATLVDSHHSGGGGAAVPHCQSCLPFFASALAPPLLCLEPLAYAVMSAEVPVSAPPLPARLRAASIGARGPPTA